MRTRGRFLVGAALLVAGATASAVPFAGTYDLNVDTNGSDLKVHATPISGSLSFILDVTLKDVEFGQDYFGWDDSWTAVKGLFTLRLGSGPAKVPGPFILAFLGGGLLLFAAIRRRAKRGSSDRS